MLHFCAGSEVYLVMGHAVENRLTVFGKWWRKQNWAYETKKEATNKKCEIIKKIMRATRPIPIGTLRILEDGPEWKRERGWLYMKWLSLDLLRMILDIYTSGMTASKAAAYGRVDGTSALHSKIFYKTYFIKDSWSQFNWHCIMFQMFWWVVHRNFSFNLLTTT